MCDQNELLEAAKSLARENAASEPNIVSIYLFPAEDEIRLITVDKTAAPSGEEAQAFYFAADPQLGVPVPSGLAIIRPEEFATIRTPEGWGDWSEARSIFERGERVAS